MKIYT